MEVSGAHSKIASMLKDLASKAEDVSMFVMWDPFELLSACTEVVRIVSEIEINENVQRDFPRIAEAVPEIRIRLARTLFYADMAWHVCSHMIDILHMLAHKSSIDVKDIDESLKKLEEKETYLLCWHFARKSRDKSKIFWRCLI